MRWLALVAAVPCALMATGAAAVTLYKLVDAQGHVTYTDDPPVRFDGAVVPLEIDPGEASGRRVMPDALPPSSPSGVSVERVPPSEAAQLHAARERLETARAALQVAQESSTAGDWIYFGPDNPLGMRRAPRPEYQAHLERLRAQIRQAEAELAQAQRRLRTAAR